jgi:hypothetical protein
MPSTPITVLTVFNSQAIGGTDGRVAMVLETKELGPVAFEVDQRVIDAIRNNLLVAKQLLRQSTINE